MLRVPAFESLEAIDWNDFERAARVTQGLLVNLARDRALMAELVTSVEGDPFLFDKCEHDVVEDKIVLYEDMEKGFRLRLRLATACQEELAHQHRFSFSTLVLRGSYLHRTYALDKPFEEGVRPDDLLPVWIHEDGPGTAFTIHHSAIHSTPLAERDTIALVLRGPAVKKVAPVLFKQARHGKPNVEPIPAARDHEPAAAERGHMFWRHGEKDELPERRRERQMSVELLRHWCHRLRELDVI